MKFDDFRNFEETANSFDIYPIQLLQILKLSHFIMRFISIYWSFRNIKRKFNRKSSPGSFKTFWYHVKKIISQNFACFFFEILQKRNFFHIIIMNFKKFFWITFLTILTNLATFIKNHYIKHPRVNILKIFP